MKEIQALLSLLSQSTRDHLYTAITTLEFYAHGGQDDGQKALQTLQHIESTGGAEFLNYSPSTPPDQRPTLEEQKMMEDYQKQQEKVVDERATQDATPGTQPTVQARRKS